MSIRLRIGDRVRVGHEYLTPFGRKYLPEVYSEYLGTVLAIHGRTCTVRPDKFPKMKETVKKENVTIDIIGRVKLLMERDK
jgi:hypothetical protein